MWGSASTMKMRFEEERETKGTIRFREVLADELDTANIGTIYVAKTALKAMKWQRGQVLEVEIKLSK